jgi:hypothetical protein
VFSGVALAIGCLENNHPAKSWMIFEMLLLVIPGKSNGLAYMKLAASFPGKRFLIRRGIEFLDY